MGTSVLWRISRELNEALILSGCLAPEQPPEILAPFSYLSIY